MQIQNFSIDAIKPYENNPRINDDAVKAVAESIKQFGWQQPLVVDKDNVLIVGHTRLKAAQQLGLKEVPVLVADNLTPEQAKAYRLLDNKTGDIALWDIAKLKKEIDELDFDFEPFDIAFFPDDKDLAYIFDENNSQDEGEGELKQYQIIIDCDNEEHQQNVLSELKKEGLNARAI